MLIRAARLTPGDRELARRLVATMAEVFDQGCEPLSDDYIDRLLAREDFWAIAASVDDQPVGGLTAYTIPMTFSRSWGIALAGTVKRHQ